MTETRPTASARPRGLWLSKELPFPLDAGDRVYSGHLASALAQAGADITFVGFPPDDAGAVDNSWPLTWRAVPGQRRSTLRSLFSTLPLVAAGHATPDYRAAVRQLAHDTWDFVIVDNYAMAWALQEFRSANIHAREPVFVFIAHDHAEALTRAIYDGFQGSAAKRLALWLNHRKTAVLERKAIQQADVISVITENDAATFGRMAPGAQVVMLKPGFTGHTAASRHIEAATPKQVVMVGSFLWVAKQENLRRFLEVADPVFARHGIAFHVLGKMPPTLKAHVEATTQATTVHGFVEDVAPHFAQARLAVVPEVIGGGFKMKLLDYVFGRVPVAVLSQAARGLPSALTDAMILADDVESMVQAICDRIDDVGALNGMQDAAFAQAQTDFRWEDRGRSLLQAIQRAAAQQSNPASAPESPITLSPVHRGSGT